MSRSRRKSPCTGITTARSEKQDKRMHNRKFRRISRQKKDPDDMPQVDYEVTNPWSMDKDGKSWFDPEKYPELMRK